MMNAYNKFLLNHISSKGLFNASRRFIAIPNSMSNDPYMLLGVDRNTKFNEIKKKYFILAKKYHPDLNPGNDVTIHFHIYILGNSMQIKCSSLLEKPIDKLNQIITLYLERRGKKQPKHMSPQLKHLIKSLSQEGPKTNQMTKVKIPLVISRVQGRVTKHMIGMRRNF